ncbi:ParB/RepB/Spo0J family partition protein [Actinomadura madurae]|uniref:ParB/RepB/Spo0J family partition protein n=1 Tax=Actinomadura madurae TaxID=1993 RepID=UPI0020260728|nr:ParB/RepB/Spo0J family partition protein [Actinomadura madurae]MCP9952204.1 ParB/RepB/Spo0J family partition protein [Actinomadura madurae]MCP9968961.1 ParB/RepB/Spo0J family partition protein [Actinomadura madurae]MCP9981434.1 ParB/RepB/Spo0J family partition protein [Actinomadura madurae]MCQ0017637.1 ParB/RepB/Spo0J family partition protein [Actinomadura madurae]URM97732.1 ParB/RepB/Spo0J family partition protein [Actinomadura madurae]
MSQQRRGLGKGLGALIPTAPPPPTPAEPGSAGEPGFPGGTVPNGTAAPDPALQPVAGAHFAELPVRSITVNPRQPREHFDEQALEELAESISIVGLLQPIVVRRSTSEEHDYELIMGERRWRASQQAGLDVIPAIVRDTGDNELLRDALMENLHRQQLNPLEEAAAYQQLLQDFGATHEQLAGRIGRSRPHISNTLRLLNLPPAVQRRVAAGVLSAGHARALLSLDSVEAQEHLAQRIVQEGLSVRALEEMIALREVEDEPKAPRQGRRKKPVAPGLQQLADRLSDRYDTKVRVDMGRNKGKIVVEFATLEDLDRIIKSMAPDEDDADDS